MLIIKKQIELPSGIELTNVVARIETINYERGDKIGIKAIYYQNEAAFDAKKQPLDADFVKSTVVDYDRETNGADTLQYAHEQFKQVLIDTYGTQPIIEQVPALDENNDPVLDENGEAMTTETTTGTTYFFESADIEVSI